MSLLSIASNASAWRGYEYYEGKRVLSWEQTGEHEFTREVAGRGIEPYHVIIDAEHPKKSICNCPHAGGKKIYASTKSPSFLLSFRRRRKVI